MITLLFVSAMSPLAPMQDAFDNTLFDEALSHARRLLSTSLSRDDRVRVLETQFRCEFYLGRGADAERTVKALLGIAPAYELDTRNNPPQVVEFFRQVRASQVKHQAETSQLAQLKAAREREDLQRARQLRVASYVAFAIGGAALVAGASTFVAGQLGARQLAADIRGFNDDPDRTRLQRAALDQRAAGLGALDVATIAMIGVTVAGAVTGGVLYSYSQPRVPRVGIGWGSITVAGTF